MVLEATLADCDVANTSFEYTIFIRRSNL